MEFLWILLILFIVFPPVGAAVGILAGLVGMLIAPLAIYFAWRSDRSMWNDHNKK